MGVDKIQDPVPSSAAAQPAKATPRPRPKPPLEPRAPLKPTAPRPKPPLKKTRPPRRMFSPRRTRKKPPTAPPATVITKRAGRTTTIAPREAASAPLCTDSVVATAGPAPRPVRPGPARRATTGTVSFEHRGLIAELSRVIANSLTFRPVCALKSIFASTMNGRRPNVVFATCLVTQDHHRWPKSIFFLSSQQSLPVLSFDL